MDNYIPEVREQESYGKGTEREWEGNGKGTGREKAQRT